VWISVRGSDNIWLFDVHHVCWKCSGLRYQRNNANHPRADSLYTYWLLSPVSQSTTCQLLHSVDVVVNVSSDLKLFGREIIFEVFQPMWSWYLNVTDGQTDRRTDGRTIYDGITAVKRETKYRYRRYYRYCRYCKLKIPISYQLKTDIDPSLRATAPPPRSTC